MQWSELIKTQRRKKAKGTQILWNCCICRKQRGGKVGEQEKGKSQRARGKDPKKKRKKPKKVNTKINVKKKSAGGQKKHRIRTTTVLGGGKKRWKRAEVRATSK